MLRLVCALYPANFPTLVVSPLFCASSTNEIPGFLWRVANVAQARRERACHIREPCALLTDPADLLLVALDRLRIGHFNSPRVMLSRVEFGDQAEANKRVMHIGGELL